MQELESKYLLVTGKKPGKALRHLLQDLVWAGFHVHPKGTRLIHDVYFDTPDGRLKLAGWSLRCRHKGLALQLTCKQLGSVRDGWFERREIEQTTLHDVPALDTLGDGPVLELLKRYIPASAELGPVFSQDNRRTAYLLSHVDYPRSSIELVLDRVLATGVPALGYIEFEGELKQGPTALLAEFEAVMAVQPGLSRSRISKFQRGHFNTHPEVDSGDRKRDLMTPDDPWSRLGTHYLQEQFQALSAYEPYAYEGLHAEGVHQMRVATRRLRAALRAFGNVLPEQQARTLSSEAGWLCDVLGRVRDLDVHLLQLSAYRHQLPESRHGSLRTYERHLHSDLVKARRCLMSALDSGRYSRFLISCQQLLKEAESLHDVKPTAIGTFARGYVPSRLLAIRKAGRKISRKSDPEAYHKLRIRIKKLRYQLEILHGPYGRELDKASRALRRLQSHLGDHQDACVAEAELALYRDNQARGSREKRTFDWLIRLETSRAAALRHRFPKDWQRFEKESLKLKKVF